MSNKRFSHAVAVALLLLSSTSMVIGCMYGPPFASVCEKYANADGVIVATIASVKSGGKGQYVKLTIERVYKGKFSRSITLDQPTSTCDWNFNGEEDQKMLLYLSRNKGQRSYHAIGTAYGGRFDRVDADLDWLGGLPGSLKKNRISGTIELYQHDPFNFLGVVPNVRLTVSNGKLSFDVRSDARGVFQLWNLPPGKYKINPFWGDRYKQNLTLSSGEIEFKQVSKDKVDTDDFEVILKERGCGGADYVLNKSND